MPGPTGSWANDTLSDQGQSQNGKFLSNSVRGPGEYYMERTLHLEVQDPHPLRDGGGRELPRLECEIVGKEKKKKKGNRSPQTHCPPPRPAKGETEEFERPPLSGCGSLPLSFPNQFPQRTWETLDQVWGKGGREEERRLPAHRAW